MTCEACPFAFSDKSEYVQSLGCLPTPYEIVKFRTVHNKTWACHENDKKPCKGALQYLQSNNLPSKVVDKELVKDIDDWGKLC